MSRPDGGLDCPFPRTEMLFRSTQPDCWDSPRAALRRRDWRRSAREFIKRNALSDQLCALTPPLCRTAPVPTGPSGPDEFGTFRQGQGRRYQCSHSAFICPTDSQPPGPVQCPQCPVLRPHHPPPLHVPSPGHTPRNPRGFRLVVNMRLFSKALPFRNFRFSSNIFYFPRPSLNPEFLPVGILQPSQASIVVGDR